MMLFIADIHLSTAQEAPLTTAFLSFLTGKARDASGVYILGDLFDGWLGDDMGLVSYTPIITALADYRQAGHDLWIGHGNRDFLLKEAFFLATQARFLAEETEIKVGNESAVLLHGDSLCTEDVSYQAFRQQAQDPQWQAKVLALSIQERLALLARIKEQSRVDTAQKSAAMMDVTQEALLDLWQRHPDCQHIIHGHTHQPAYHAEPNGKHRWVVGDWRPQAEILAFEETTGFSLISI